MATVAVDKGKEHPISELAEEAMEAGFEADVEVPYVCDFEEGDKVVYPHHGAATIQAMGRLEDHYKLYLLLANNQPATTAALADGPISTPRPPSPSTGLVTSSPTRSSTAILSAGSPVR